MSAILVHFVLLQIFQILNFQTLAGRALHKNTYTQNRRELRRQKCKHARARACTCVVPRRILSELDGVAIEFFWIRPDPQKFANREFFIVQTRNALKLDSITHKLIAHTCKLSHTGELSPPQRKIPTKQGAPCCQNEMRLRSGRGRPSAVPCYASCALGPLWESCSVRDKPAQIGTDKHCHVASC